MLPRTEQSDADLLKLIEGSTDASHRAEAEVELGRRHARRGEHDQALRYFVSARARFDAAGESRHTAEVDIEIGVACASKGSHDRAYTYLAQVLDVADEIGDDDLHAQAQIVLGELAYSRGEFGQAGDLWRASRAHFLEYWDGAALSRCNGGLALVALENGDQALAKELVARSEEEAEAAGDPMWVGRAHLARARVAWADEDLKQSKRCFRRAITTFRNNDLRRELAEAYLRYGLFSGYLGERLDDGTTDPAAYWLAKAQDLFRDLGGLGDLERIREAFRRYGRRATDRVAEVEVLQLLQELKHSRLTVQRCTAQMADMVMDAAERFAGGLGDDSLVGARHKLLQVEQTLSRSLDEMALAEERFLAAVNAVVVERENIRTLVELARTLSAIDDAHLLQQEIARRAAQLTSGDRALVALGDRTSSRVLGVYGIDIDADRSWASAVGETVAGTAGARMLMGDDAAPGESEGVRPRTRIDEDRQRKGQMGLGYAMVVPLRHGEQVLGAIYVDKEITGGVFTDRDLDLLSVFAGQAATMLENLRIQDDLKLAARVKAATLNAVSDGVVAIDARGTITSINHTACRFLGIEPGEGAQRKLSSVHEIAFLGSCLKQQDELDGRIITLSSSEYLCNSRIIRDDQGDSVGMVATFTELKRATNLAQRIVGSTARYSFGDIVGSSAALKRQIVLAEAAARSTSNVLLTGESGTGKEVLAQAIHNGSTRAGGSFVAVNCAAIPRDLLESELFGYESGAFTGARKGGRPGKFELAEGGTILLDEIGDMPLEMQAKLLRVLQERTTQRLGGTRDIPLDCRIIATTNRDLTAEVGRGLFRQDLFFRLRVIHIALPPLRDRPEDVEMLVRHFLRIYSARLDKQLADVEPTIMEHLKQYPWPGNVRELEHVLEGEVNLVPPEATVLSELPVMLEMGPITAAALVAPAFTPPGYAAAPAAPVAMGPAHAPPYMHAPAPMAGGYAPPFPGGYAPIPTAAPVKTMSESERELLEQALVAHHGKVPAVARALGVSRGTIYNKMKKFNLDPARYRR